METKETLIVLRNHYQNMKKLLGDHRKKEVCVNSE